MQQEVPFMPNRTIYVADADLQLFEKAQSIAGGNLSAAVAQALRHFVEAQEKKVSGFEEVTVKVGKIAYTHKRFQGRLLSRARILEQDDTREVLYRVFLTPKGNLALHVRNTPNWNYWSSSKARRKYASPENWSQWSSYEEEEYRLEVYHSLEELEHNVPSELYEAVAQVINTPDGVEDLDI